MVGGPNPVLRRDRAVGQVRPSDLDRRRALPEQQPVLGLVHHRSHPDPRHTGGAVLVGGLLLRP